MLHWHREILDVPQVRLVHGALRQNLRDTPIRNKLIESCNLLRDIIGAVHTILEIHRPHNNYQLIDGLFINQELSLRAVIDFAANLVLDNADVGGAEVSRVQGCCHDIPANRILRFCCTYCRAKAKSRVVVARAGC